MDPYNPFSADSVRALRGGGFADDPSYCRSSHRRANGPLTQWNDIGFRVALSVKGVKKLLANIPKDAPRFALQFDGQSSCVHVPSLGRNEDAPGTLEAMVIPARNNAPHYESIIAWQGARIFTLSTTHQFQTLVVGQDGMWSHVMPQRTVVPGQLVHLASVWDGERLCLYVDGRPSPVKPTTNPGGLKLPKSGLFLGANSLIQNEPKTSFAFAGIISQVRISRVPRYTTDFQPPTQFAADDDTLALYRFDEGQGDILHDSSRNGHDGQIIGAKWVELPGA